MTARSFSEAFEHARGLDAPLGERLADYASSMRSLNAPMSEAIDRLIARLKGGKLGDAAPNEGDHMPDFVLPDDKGRLVALPQLLRTGPVAITFARGHWCPYCRIAVSALGEVADHALQLGGQIIVIVPDRQEFAANLRAEANAPLPILTDIDNGYALGLGLVFWVGEEMKGHMQQRAADPTKSQGNESWFVPIPATFVVGRDGRVVARHVDPDYRKRMEIDAVLDALRVAAAA